MARSYSKNKDRNESGGFGGLPRSVWKHPDYKRLSGGAVKLLMELACQYRGKNNGDLTTAYSVLKDRGFNSKDTITRAKNELLAAKLIIQTRQGRFINPGAQCELYALSWKSIDECSGKHLETKPTSTPPRAFSLENTNRNPSPESGPGSYQNLGRQRERDDAGRFVSS